MERSSQSEPEDVAAVERTDADPRSLERRTMERTVDYADHASLAERVTKLEGELAALKAKLLHWV